jgi:TM2 domain-containing membrane protein YozV
MERPAIKRDHELESHRIHALIVRYHIAFGQCRAKLFSASPALCATMNDTHRKTIGYLLWLFGFTGSHRFYYGRPLTGALWFFTFGLLGVGWILDLFLIPRMDRIADLRHTAGRYDHSVAWLLQTFLGPLGLHRFYLGKIWSGLLWLLTGGLFLVGYLYDFCTLNQQVDERNRSVGQNTIDV